MLPFRTGPFIDEVLSLTPDSPSFSDVISHRNSSAKRSGTTTGSFQVADNSSRWTPPWRESERGIGSLVLTWTLPPVLYLDLAVSTPGSVVWLRTWLERYLDGKGSSADDDPDLSFFYMIVGAVGATPAEGIVDGRAVLEAGFGGAPVGPSEAGTTTLRHMVRWVVGCLGE